MLKINQTKKIMTGTNKAGAIKSKTHLEKMSRRVRAAEKRARARYVRRFPVMGELLPDKGIAGWAS